ncbi:MAG TPA: IPT/TIG domain-containing protein [Ktedonobacterales bacterium]
MDQTPEDRLDSLISRLNEGEEPTSTTLRSNAAELSSLLDAANIFAAWGNASPSQAFSQRLERQLREVDLPRREQATVSAATRGARARQRLQAQVSSRHISTRIVWPVLAAMLALLLGVTTLAAARNAEPGQALYGVRRWEQGLNGSLTSQAGNRVRLHLQYASEALAAFTAAVNAGSGSQAYSDALQTLSDETAAAKVALNDVPAGREQSDLDGQVEQLQADARAGLHASLPALGWHDRIIVSSAIANQGESVVRITNVTMVRVTKLNITSWRITITGSGFEPGAVVLVNGSPSVSTSTMTATSLTIQLPGSAFRDRPISIGVGNPDETAAATSTFTREADEGDDSTGGDDHRTPTTFPNGTRTPAQTSPTPHETETPH